MHALQKILQAVEDKDDRYGARVRQYSGRGMQGRNCLAVYGSRCQLASLMSEALKARIEALVESTQDNHVASPEDLDAQEVSLTEINDALEVIFHFERDNMGHDFVYYWPDVEYTEDQDTDE